jgi:hypothetical protein
VPAHPLSKALAQQAVKAIDAANGNAVHAARALGINRSTLINRIEAAKLQGIEPRAAGNVTGTSTLYDGDGNVKLQWIKSANEKGPAQWMAEFKEAFAAVQPIRQVKKPRRQFKKDLLTVYPIGDHHVAMYAWAEEAGADYDIKISDKLLTSAMAHLVEVSPESDTALLINVGDFFHVDNLKNETSRSGNTLDVDTRYAAMVRAGLKMLRTAIATALTKHNHVKVICAIGNHDDVGSLWLSTAMDHIYSAEPRVSVEISPSKFHYHRHGKVLIGVTHGDTGKPEKLQSVMAADRPEDWGETRFRYWMTGHIHSRKVLEFPGVMWETFRTLAPNDAWANAAGYRSGRDMTSIVFHREHGEIGRSRFDVSMVAA